MVNIISVFAGLLIGHCAAKIRVGKKKKTPKAVQTPEEPNRTIFNK